MAAAWHREEPRDVRPFFRAKSAEHALESCGIRLFDDGEPLYEAVYDLDEIDFQKLAPSVRVHLADPKEWMPEGLTTDDLELVLFARHGFLKKSVAVTRYRLHDVPEDIGIDMDLLADMGGGRNMQLTLALCLAEDRQAEPGSPFVIGHWLARKSFSLKTRTSQSLFDVRVRTDEEWIANGYPAKTFFVVEYTGGIDAEAEEGASVARVYVHADAHNRMVNSPVGETLQPLLAAEIITTILQLSLEEWKELTAAPSGSPLATVLKQFGKIKPMTIAELRALVSNPAKLRAELHDRLGVVRAIG